MALLDDADDFGSRLRKLRRARGLNQQELASEDVSVSYVSLLETGKRTPSDAVFATLAARLGCSVELLRTGRDDRDSEQIELKLAFGDIALRNGENGEALQAYSEALAARPRLSEEALRRAQLGQALAFEKMGRLEAAVQLLGALYESPATVPGSQEWSLLAVALCRCYREQGDQVRSVEVGEQALRQLETLGLDLTDDHMQIGATLVSCYRRRGDLMKAHLVATRLIDMADRAGSPFGRGVIYWNAGMVAHSMGRTSQALELTERALTLLAEEDNLRLQAMLKNAYAWLLLEGDPGNAAHALEVFTQSLEPLQDVGTASELARLERNQAQAYLSLGSAEAAQEHARRALALLNDEHREETALAYLFLSQAQFLAREIEPAEESLGMAEERLRQVAHSRQTAVAWRQVGDLWSRYGKAENALAAYQRALDDAGLRSVPLTTAGGRPQPPR